MKPVMQTVFGYPSGNCFMASLASVLEIPLEKVPDYNPKNYPDWWKKYNRWLFDNFGLGIIEVQYGDGLWFAETFDGEVYHLCSGKSPRGLEHSCVGLNGKIVHDPHPDRSGLVAITHVDLFVAVEPWKYRKDNQS